MRLFRFDAAVGRAITLYQSYNIVFNPILKAAEGNTIACMHIQQRGVVGYHPTVKPQLFLVVQGEGWVRGESPDRVPISAGQAAFWEEGENHESGSAAGMTAIVIEGDNLDPAQYLVEISDKHDDR